jgi:hypothetical protein
LFLPALAAAAVASLALGERPAGLTGPEGAKAYAEWLRDEALKTDALYVRQSVCAKALVSEAVAPTYQAIPASNGANAGLVAQEHLIVAGCGRAWRVNLAVSRGDGGGWRASPMLPGNSNAGFLLQSDVLKVLLPAVGRSNPDCPGPVWNAVVLLDPPGEQGVWVEEWSLSACGAPVDLDLTFTPTADGGTDFGAKAHTP